MIQVVAGSSPVGRPIFLFSNMAFDATPELIAPMKQVEANLGYFFADGELLKFALTHPSLIAESKSHSVDNQRLEFLGDAVLQLSLTEALYRQFPEEGEGVLTKWRARLVSKPALATFGRALGLGPAMLMGKGEEANGGRDRASTLSDCVEAVLGAVYLDGGYEAAKLVVLRMTGEALQTVVKSPQAGNPKGELQERLQALAPESPLYEILSAKGPDHEKLFVSSVTWRGSELGRGRGASKKSAETAAALDALRSGRWQSVLEEH